jgi:hypothetical protein
MDQSTFGLHLSGLTMAILHHISTGPWRGQGATSCSCPSWRAATMMQEEEREEDVEQSNCRIFRFLRESQIYPVTTKSTKSMILGSFQLRPRHPTLLHGPPELRNHAPRLRPASSIQVSRAPSIHLHLPSLAPMTISQ